MPRQRRNRRNRSKKPDRSMTFDSAGLARQRASSALDTAIITPIRSQSIIKQIFRFNFSTAVPLTTNFTTTMFLDMYCAAVGGSAAPVRLFNNMKLLRVRIWASVAAADVGSTYNDSIILEFSPGTAAGFGGAPRTPYTATVGTTSKYAHLNIAPRPNELASQWFSAQQTAYTLLNMALLADSTVDFEFLCVPVNGETPVACAYTTSVAKGTLGVTNFGVAGCRSVGLENLVNP